MNKGNENMRPGKRGGLLKSGNTVGVGHPKGKRLSSILEKMMEAEVTLENDDGTKMRMTAKEAIAFRLIADAYLDEDPAVRARAAKQLFEHTDPIDTKTPITPNSDEVVVFYIPNQNSRKREDEKEDESE